MRPSIVLDQTKPSRFGAFAGRVPHVTLEAGRMVYHGTAVTQNFQLPKGPAWFCFQRKSAMQWAGWGGENGQRRVLLFSVKQPVTLYDTSERADWETLCETYDLDDGQSYELAKRLAAQGHGGWYGPTEIMLARPEDVLTYLATMPVPENFPLKGRDVS